MFAGARMIHPDPGKVIGRPADRFTRTLTACGNGVGIICDCYYWHDGISDWEYADLCATFRGASRAFGAISCRILVRGVNCTGEAALAISYKCEVRSI